MSTRYLGGLVRKTPLVLNPALGNAANGVFTIDQAMQAVKNGTWPAYDPYFDYTTLLLHGDGANGARNADDSNATANTGGAGSGLPSVPSFVGGTGGSGIVIIKWS